MHGSDDPPAPGPGLPAPTPPDMPDHSSTLNELEAFLRQPDAIMEPSIVDRLREYVMANGHPQQAVEYLSDSYQGYAQMAVLVCQWLAAVQHGAAGNDPGTPRAASQPPLDEASCLRVDGRQLIYDLSGRYANSLLLNFAIQKILQQPGREAEVAAVGPRLGSYFGVFHRLMQNASQSQHTYIHVQSVLQSLGAHPQGARFRRLAADLAGHAAQTQGAVVWRLSPLFWGEPGSGAVGPLLADLMASVEGGPLPSLEVIRLCALYGAEPAEARPSLDLLRHPRVFRVLLAALFGPGQGLAGQALAGAVELLARAAAGGPEREAAVEATRAALMGAVTLTRKALHDAKLSAEELEGTGEVLTVPICAAGLLCGMELRLAKPAHWSTTFHGLRLPPFLALLRRVIPLQPQLHDEILRLIGSILEAMGNSNHDVARALLDCAVQLLAAGRVLQVLEWAAEYRARADPSLLRHLAYGVLEAALPPYSPAFASALLRLMMHAGVKQPRAPGRDAGLRALLDEFAAGCSALEFRPPLSSRESAFLLGLCEPR
ncbi:hypothetical protein APUTEX25_005115 [Auxenochlorella protothecoides]|uniref:Negative elongation factor D n=1 Tax=Auxenochlorella protothecoides TaxID=3075 RepID=A0A3M7KVH8_AUXPR|nr:hypothetical protein APUTEX25_005115 [Auxenochlorella protothecoides]|eukprot:RMZ53126.1 hypothetical protein APUTEX25_005115 [Auxenochlorella protothecoides]